MFSPTRLRDSLNKNFPGRIRKNFDRSGVKLAETIAIWSEMYGEISRKIAIFVRNFSTTRWCHLKILTVPSSYLGQIK